MNGGTQVSVPDTREKCNCLRHAEILDGYDEFNTYAVVGSLMDTTNLGRLDVQRHVTTLEDSREVSRLSSNNKEYISIINPLSTIFTRILQTIIITN